MCQNKIKKYKTLVLSIEGILGRWIVINLEEFLHAKILIVDDNLANILLLEKLLQKFGYAKIKKTTDSRETLKLYLSYQPDLLLLDLKMPNLDGFQVLEQLSQVKGDDYLSVVAITAQDDQEYRLRALKMGAKDFITKPFDHAEILIRIRNMLEMRLLHKKVKEHSHHLEDKVRERTKEIEKLQIELVQRLVLAAEFRDNDTGNHISRISKYTYALAKAIGLDDKQCSLLYHASAMHDIGKIGIPDEILLKPGSLSPEEWEKMKTHTLKGVDILAGSTFEMIQMAEEIALTHHERWDGSGYPQGLIGEEIPLAGRITAICDVFDALISDRPYKKAWTVEKAIKQIIIESGTHFDPDLVEVFIRVLPEIIEGKELYG